jgi:hypothetical protein
MNNVSEKLQTPKAVKPSSSARPPMPRYPKKNSNRTTIQMMPGSDGGSSGWLFALLVLMIGSAITFSLYKQHIAQGESEETTEIVRAEENLNNSRINADENARLPDIVPNPEKDDKRILLKTTIENDNNFVFETDESTSLPEKPVKEAPPASPEKEDPKEPGMVRKMVTNRVPNTYNISPERTLDLLVLYSPGVKERLGGPGKLLTHVNGLVNHANKRFHKYNAVGRIRLVGLVEVEYTSAGTLDTDLKNLSGDRVKAGVRHVNVASSFRNKVGADMVTLFCGANLGAGGGLAYVPGVFSVMNCPIGAIFTHELQHNFGWGHENKTNLSMIHANFPIFAKWKPTVIPENKVYVQYWINKPKTVKIPSAGIEF